MSNGDGTYSALLGDPRNDENLIIAGLHCAHILFYNRVLDELANIDSGTYSAAPAWPGLVLLDQSGVLVLICAYVRVAR